MTTATYSVPGVSCGHCETAIKGEIEPIDGVQAVVVDLEAKTVTVTADDTAAIDDAVRAAIDEAGYEVADA
ncbi:MAG: heavy-metal-associated domain-containing protein [Actinomycetes bacterium]